MRFKAALLSVLREERIEVSSGLWSYISYVIAQSTETITEVTISNITVDGSLSDIKPFHNLPHKARIMIADEGSYTSILGGRSESKVNLSDFFGCNASNIIKQWLNPANDCNLN